MNKSLLTLSLLLLTSVLFAQSIKENMEWANAFQDRGLSNLFVETDSLDNVYTVGVYRAHESSFVLWNSDTIVTQGDNSKDIFISKIDAAGNLIWHDLIEGQGDLILIGFRMDNNSNLILYIENSEAFTYMGHELAKGYNLLKLNLEATLIWSVNVQGAIHNRHDSIYPFFREQISINCANEIIIGGSLSTHDDTNTIIDSIDMGYYMYYIYAQENDTLIIDGESFTAENSNVFLSKIAANGTLAWTKIIEHTNTIQISSIWAEESEDIHVLGFFQYDDLIIENDTLPIDTLGYAQKRNVIILKLDSDGAINWVKKYFDDVVTTNLVVDGEGGILSTGSFYEETYFEENVITSNGVQDMLLFKVDADGNYLWAVNAGNFASNQRCNLLSNSENEIYLSGSIGTTGQVIINKYTPAGQLLYELLPDSSSNVHAGDLTFDNSGNLIHTGIYQGDFVMGGELLSSAVSGDWHQYILKFKEQTQVDETVYCREGINATDDRHEEIEMSVFPNPTTGTIDISISGQETKAIRLEVTDLQGKAVHFQQSNFSGNSISADLQQLPAGLYVLRVITDQGAGSKMVVVAN